MLVNLTHRHQAEVIGDKRDQRFITQHQRVLLEQRAVFRRFDMFIEHLQTTVLHQFQQFIEQHQQLTLILVGVFILTHDAAELAIHFRQHGAWVGENHRPQTRTQNDDDFTRLPERRELAARHNKAADHTGHDDYDTE